VDTGSRQETRQNKNLEPRFDSIEAERALELENVGAAPRQVVQISQGSANRVAAAAVDLGKLRLAGWNNCLDRQASAGFADDLQPGLLLTRMLVEVHLRLSQ
jgi:hypothetical protein